VAVAVPVGTAPGAIRRWNSAHLISAAALLSITKTEALRTPFPTRSFTIGQSTRRGPPESRVEEGAVVEDELRAARVVAVEATQADPGIVLSSAARASVVAASGAAAKAAGEGVAGHVDISW
jgi:hypothetical protein